MYSAKIFILFIHKARIQNLFILNMKRPTCFLFFFGKNMPAVSLVEIYITLAGTINVNEGNYHFITYCNVRFVFNMKNAQAPLNFFCVLYNYNPLTRRRTIFTEKIELLFFVFKLPKLSHASNLYSCVVKVFRKKSF